MKTFFLCALCVSVASLPAQVKLEPVPPTKEQQQPRFTSQVREVSTPVTVIDAKGQFVTDLEKVDFTITDNRVPQRIRTFELTWQPISLAIVVDTSARVEGLLPQIRPSGILFTQLVMGETGEAALLVFDHLVEVKQDFTTNGDLIEKAMKDLKPGGGEARMTDGVLRAIGMLKNRAEQRRKVIVVIGEGRDMGSESPLGPALREAQLSGIAIYAVELSTMKALLGKPLDNNQGRDPLPPGARPTRPGQTPAPQGVSGVNMMPLIIELVRGGKALLWDKPLKIYATGTGADHINVYTNRGIEEAVEKIGRELHSQYLLSYLPNNLQQEEFHSIEVQVSRPAVKVRARPGYYYLPTQPAPTPTGDGAAPGASNPDAKKKVVPPEKRNGPGIK